MQAVTTQPAIHAVPFVHRDKACSPDGISVSCTDLQVPAGTLTPRAALGCLVPCKNRAKSLRMKQRAKLRLQKGREVQTNPEIIQQCCKQWPRAPPAESLAGCCRSQKSIGGRSLEEITLDQLLQGRHSSCPRVSEHTALLPVPAHVMSFTYSEL